MKNVFVIGLDDFHRELMEHLPQAREAKIHGLLRMEEVRRPDEIPVESMLNEAIRRLDAFDGTIDAIVGNWDFPVNVMVPMLRARYALPTTSLESVVKCEHKHWCRLLQSEVIPECVPAFEGVDPFDEHAAQRINLQFPYWIKPVIAYCSYLGFYIDQPDTLHHALEAIRENIGRIAEPATWVLQQVELPPGLGGSDGARCLAESIIAGHQCTLEGFIHKGRAEVYGVIDSLREENLSSFASYRYPSRLPESVQERMIDAACKTVEHVGLDDSCFNIEFFWDERTDHVWLLEVNTRLSESHCDLFEKVDGVSNQSVMLDLALGRRPTMPRRRGRFKVAGKFFIRHYTDARVTRVPTADEVAALEAEIPGTKVWLRVEEGQRLSERPDQDSYSYELAWVHLGADDHDQLEQHLAACRLGLRFEFAEEGEPGGPQL